MSGLQLEAFFAPLLTAKDETCIAWIFISVKGKNSITVNTKINNSPAALYQILHLGDR